MLTFVQRWEYFNLCFQEKLEKMAVTFWRHIEIYKQRIHTLMA